MQSSRSEALFHAGSLRIEPFEGRRPRLRRTRPEFGNVPLWDLNQSFGFPDTARKVEECKFDQTGKGLKSREQAKGVSSVT